MTLRQFLRTYIWPHLTRWFRPPALARPVEATTGELAGRTDSLPRATFRPVPPPPDIAPLLAKDSLPPSDTGFYTAPASSNRAARRALERARRKHDKFVQPQGPQPTLYPHEHHDDDAPEPPKTKHVQALPEGPVIEDPNDRIIAGEWLEGDGEKVLYEESEFWGEFNFRDTILEQLDRYWVYLARMKKYDPDAYGFYKQMGAVLMPYARTDTMSDKPSPLAKVKDIKAYKRGIHLSPFFKETWPAFGCCAFGANPRDEKAESIKIDGHYIGRPKFLYFRRVEKFPWTVQPTHGGKLYALTVWWDRVIGIGGHRYKWGRPMEFAIQISDDGEQVRILKTRVRPNGKIRPDGDWRIPYEYQRWAKCHGLDAQTHLASIFCASVRDIEYAQMSMLRIEVSKGDLTATFGLSARRTAYFFQDRDIVLNEKGRKKRVFHMVRPYVDKNGVKHPTQFRGLREFTWAGYKVFITVPGRDHFMPLAFNLPSKYGERGRKGHISEPQLGKNLKEQLHRETDQGGKYH